ncbi:MAG: FKBP-type peptidyl-prolyl cis-trans isomerase [Candidatus Krumholzibacteriia bacterium]
MKRSAWRATMLLLCAGALVVGCQGSRKVSDEQKAKAAAGGLQVQDLTPGTGDEAKTGDFLVVDYTGWLSTNGKQGEKFDSSLDRGVPFTVRLGYGRVIAGWDQGLLGMKVGGTRRLIIPPELGYGARPSGPIPPNSTLIFDVILRNIPRVQSRDIVVGNGPPALEGDVCDFNYTGWLYENGARGKQFDSSVGGKPFQVTLGAGDVIPGWDTGLVGMKVGGKRELIIPPELAYGKRGAGDVIPADATLLFEVELVSVAGKPAGAPGSGAAPGGGR